MAKCALTTSLSLGARTKEVYSTGLSVLGTAYARGDNACRRALAAQRDLLQDQVVILRAALASVAGPLDINVILQASETARTASVQALADQYRRMAMDRADVPCELQAVKWRSPSRETPLTDSNEKTKGQNRGAEEYTTEQIAAPALPPRPPEKVQAPSARWLTYLEDDNMTTAWSVLSGPLVFQSEPPSPPLTPKELALLPPVPPLPEEFKSGSVSRQSAIHPTANATTDKTNAALADLESVYGGGLSSASTKTGHSLVRPKNSVFNIFCPEAMALQVDVRRPVPPARRCRCGFRWQGEGAAATTTIAVTSMAATSSIPASRDATTLVLKEGFSMSKRFLAKSHCEGTTAGYGCVLCTSSGLAQTYETVDDLRMHINATHDKWQMLHDRDLT